MSEPEQVSFHDERLDMAHWYPRLRNIDVPTPETQPLPIERQDRKPPEWDSQLAQEIVENLGGEAFARSGYKSAQMNMNGSHVHAPTEDAVDETLTELVSQHVMMQMPLGETLWFREWLELDYCQYARDNLVPEIRVFIRDGEVVCHHPRLEGFEKVCDSHEKAARDYINQGWDDGTLSDESVETYAERVADEFSDGWWSVDFVLERGSWEWYCTDMALDAVYERDGELRGVSDHPGECEHDVMELV